jgi:hypothetical protein
MGTSMTNPSAVAQPPATEQTHPCVRCGRPVPLDVAMCDDCNPLGLKQPSASQVHGTVALGIVLAVAALALVGKLSLSGVGPFDGRIASLAPTADGLALTVTVRNEGTTAGTTSCRVTDPANEGVGAAAFVISPLVRPGQEVTFAAAITQFGTEPKPLTLVCQSP